MIEPITGVLEEFPTRAGWIVFTNKSGEDVKIPFDTLGRAAISVEAVAVLITQAFPFVEYKGEVYRDE